MSPSTNALTPLSRYPFSSAVAIGQCSQDRTAAHYDRREVDTNALEGRTHVSSYLCAVMSPAFTFMRLVGLYHVSAIKSLNAALVVYGLLIIAIQCIAAFRRVSLLQLNALTVQTASTLISAIFVCSGAIASMYLFRLGPRLRELHATVIQEVAQYDREMTDVRKIRAVSVFLVLFVVGISALIVASHAVLLMRFDDAAFYTQPLFTRHTLFIDFYVLFIGECACLMCAAIFIMCCHVLSRSTQVLVNHMNEECTDDQQSISADDAIQRIGYFQGRFQSLVEATDVVDGQFSYVHLYVVMISVPMLCFILYVAFQERCDLHFTWLEIATLAFWSVHVLFLFLLFTIPAAKLLEQSAEISTIAFRLYNGLMIEKQSVALISSVQFFATRVKAAPFSFTAGGFFTITRGTILTLLSATLSYFLVLRGFSSDPNCGTS